MEYGYNNLALTVLVDDPNFNASKIDSSPPYAYILNQEFPLDVEVQDEDFFSIILVRPHLFVNIIETEQRSRTYVSIFGVIGGAWGLVWAFYVFLFGASLIHPWGFVQSRCCGIKREIKENIDVKLSKLPEDIMEEMKKLKYLLGEYVVDLQSIEK
ncbi:6132_t:CDS:2 [Funneliformis caledonium]|uniref:6132_t:CDS:1 n=1 Tax=Funneliformis caledonium TaxID=1117310 RepID=A0A9N8Z8N6_9GLOM|nr:6132_t:CDS:2 [Funneliformis caledonium]